MTPLARKTVCTLCAAVVCLVLVGSLVVAKWSAPPTYEYADQTVARAAARIVAESGGDFVEPEPVAAPRPPGRVAAGRVQNQNTGLEDREATPPLGYAFVSHFGEMAKGRMEGPRARAGEEVHAPGWFASPANFATLAD